MPFVGTVYTPPAAAENAFVGKTITSADWNAIFTDLATALTQVAQGHVHLMGVMEHLAKSQGVTLPSLPLLSPPVQQIEAPLPIVREEVIVEYDEAVDVKAAPLMPDPYRRD